MKVSTAKMIALTCHGNAYLQGISINRFFPDNSTCMYDESVRFVEWNLKDNGEWEEKLIAATPDDWFIDLKTKNALGIELSMASQNQSDISDRESSGFIGGGVIWEMIVNWKNNKKSAWRIQEKWGDLEDSNGKIYKITFGTSKLASIPKIPELNIDKTYQNLLNSLEEIHKFSKKFDDLEYFSKVFGCAISVLIDDKPNSDFEDEYIIKDLYPDEFVGKKAQSLLLACQISDVFGGMGSWNDVGGVERYGVEYNQVSNQLFDAMNEAFICVANSTFKSLEG